MIYDVQLGSWVYFEYPNSLKKEAKKHYALKRGYFPYNFNFVKGHRGDLAQCSYCGKFLPMKQMTRDHIYPKSLGGIITTTACYDCNVNKRDLKPIEFGIQMMIEQGFMQL
jgi:5-methylcytosine-specific restriction endonuclease McrA